ncbi:hypothetical protein [Sphingomonas sp. CARO-RG-8B-R24-01]|uniref:hypothetical protein n=1 Tax=Sphingomonas sp. CARO-RG-8B-R24-01 TaxID=2914831 RepID=UPI001F59C979|nr:hypothetical protein [Sphingomonas sp. CARO-RG-8B-R24-01]
MKIILLDYPSGASGVALMLMRLSLSGLLAFISAYCGALSPGGSILVAVLACLLAGGFFTRLAASLFAIAGLLSIALRVVSPFYAPLAVEGIALALLGPGAWSIDAWTLQSGLVTLRDRSPHGR